VKLELWCENGEYEMFLTSPGVGTWIWHTKFHWNL